MRFAAQALRHYLAIFVAAGVPFAAVAGLVAGGFGGRSGLVQGVAGGLFFGAAMALALGTLSVVRQRRAGASPSGGLGPRQTRRLVVDMAPERAFETAVGLLQRLAATVETSPGRLHATGWTTGTMESAGEVVTVTVSPYESGQALVEVRSRPVVRTTVTDYGKGRRNVETLLARLARAS